ncbi:MAG: MFS transporter [Myxococcota bacterium]
MSGVKPPETPPASSGVQPVATPPASSGVQPVATPPASSRGPAATPHSLRALPPGIWALGLGSLFMDTSSELIHSLLPVFMRSVLGASMVTIGLVEGVAEATAAVTRIFSGIASDRLRRRKRLVVVGYGLAAVAKPIFPLATSMLWLFTGRFVDRIGKGIRGAPRDALVADIAPPSLRGAAYGLRQALDSVGAFLGPLLALVLMARFADDLARVLWVAVVPACLSVAVIALAVREPEHAPAPRGDRPPLSLVDARRLPLRFWLVVLLGAVFTLARFSEAFLVLRAQTAGLAIGQVPLVMIAMNVCYAAGAYPAGAASDRMRRRTLLVAGLALLIVADLVLAAATSAWHVLAGASLWGLHMALTQGLLSKLVADTTPADLRGTAFGLFHLVSGGALLLASLVAGMLWQQLGPPATFLAGAGFAAIAAVGILAFAPSSRAGGPTASGRRLGGGGNPPNLLR